jgi:hypothetical protein
MLKHSIPYVDLRGKTPVDLLRAYPDKAQELVTAARRTYGWLSYAASALVLPWVDKKSHEWLLDTNNPYLHEIETFAEVLGIRGIYALNISYEWGCTSGAYRTDETVSMLRVLDWPFPALGSNVMVVLQSSKAGDFYNITWPGVSGVYTGMAPGRFSAAINQAPMREHKKSRLRNWFENRLLVEKEDAIPPTHLLRQVFEQAKSYKDAKKMLMETPLAMPVIFTLTGLNAGEGCIIERLERTAEVTELNASPQLCTSNEFNTSLTMVGEGWTPRAKDSPGRYRQASEIHGYELATDNFDWIKAPMVNALTRLCVIADAATCRLQVQGFEGMAPATDVFILPMDTHEQRKAG